MPAPSASLATLRPDLAASFEQYDLDASRMGFVGLQLLTVVDVPTQAGNFGIIPIEQLLQNAQTQRAPGSGYGRRNFTFRPGTYAVKENGIEEPVDDREAKMYVNYFSAEVMAAKRARDVVLRNKEIRDVGKLTDTTNTFTAGGNMTAAVTGTWKTVATSDPVTDASNAIQQIYNNCGYKPDTVVVSFTDFLNCRRSANLLNQVKYSGLDDPKLPLDLAARVIAQAMGIKRMLVADAVQNTANEGQLATLAGVWPVGSVGYYVTNDSQDFKSPCVGRTFHWSEDGSSIGGTVESYREEQTRSTIIRVRQDTDEQVLYPQMGFIQTGAHA